MSDAPPSARQLVIVLSSPLADAAKLALRYAATAAAMDVLVELHVISAGAVRWLERGAASAPLLTQLRQATELGVGLFACPAALAEQGLSAEQLIPEVEGLRGAASLISAALEPQAHVLSF